jgi:signal transduction histidine kinase
MEARAKAMIGNLKISSEEGKGTRIELLFHV